MNKLLLGLVTGIAIGMIIAPAKGSVTRKKLVDTVNDLTDEFSAIRDKYFPGEEKRVYDRAFGATMMSSYV